MTAQPDHPHQAGNEPISPSEKNRPTPRREPPQNTTNVPRTTTHPKGLAATRSGRRLPARIDRGRGRHRRRRSRRWTPTPRARPRKQRLAGARRPSHPSARSRLDPVGPTARSTATAPNAPKPLTDGSGATTLSDDTQPSATRPRSPASANEPTFSVPAPTRRRSLAWREGPIRMIARLLAAPSRGGVESVGQARERLRAGAGGGDPPGWVEEYRRRQSGDVVRVG